MKGNIIIIIWSTTEGIITKNIMKRITIITTEMIKKAVMENAEIVRIPATDKMAYTNIVSRFVCIFIYNPDE